MEIVGSLIGVLVVLALIGGAVYGFTRGISNVTFGSVLAAYFALMIAVSTLLIAGGAASLGKAGLSAVAGRDFSYDTLRYDSFGPRAVPALPAAGPSATPAPPAPQKDDSVSDRAQREDIANGITYAVIGAIVLVLHLQIRRVLGPRLASAHRRNIDRAFVLGMTLVSGIGFLTASAVGLSQLLRRTILESDLQPFESPPHPGGSLAWAGVWLVLWAWFGFRLWREFNVEREQA